MGGVGRIRHLDMHGAVLEHEEVARLRNIDVVRLGLGAFAHLMDRMARPLGNQDVKMTTVLGAEVLHDDVGHTALSRPDLQQPLEGGQRSG